jgi:hypothetical protein
VAASPCSPDASFRLRPLIRARHPRAADTFFAPDAAAEMMMIQTPNHLFPGDAPGLRAARVGRGSKDCRPDPVLSRRRMGETMPAWACPT